MSRGYIGVWCSKEHRMKWYRKEDVEDANTRRRNNPVAPYVRGDYMDPLKHPGDGQFYDSKAAFDAKSKELGLAPWEPPKDWNKDGTTIGADEDLIEADLDQALYRAYHELKNDGANLDDEGQLRAKEINEQISAVTGKDTKLGRLL